MKPRSFVYHAPASLKEALGILAADPDDSKVLAGGQSLVPMMNFRLASPAQLVDINRIPGLGGIESDDHSVTVGTRTRHVEVQNNQLAGSLGTLLRKAAGYIGHLPIRVRGTFGGSIAHCDAASEWCVVASLLDAEMTAVSLARGERTIAAADFFQSTFTTALEPDEILLKVSLPQLDHTWRAGISEFARRAGDFGIIITAAAVSVVDGVVREARVSLGGVSEVPVRSVAAEQTLQGQPFSDELLRNAADAAAEEVDPPSDTHGDSEYRRDLVRALLPRALGTATMVGA